MAKSAAYWRKRAEQSEKAAHSYGQEAYREIEHAFEKAQREIQKETEAWYGRFAKNNSISMQEARVLLSKSELEELKWDVQDYIKYGKENAIDGLWMKELENASAKFHINRLEALKIRVQQAAEVAFGNELDAVDTMTRKIFFDSYYHTIYEVQKAFNIGWEIGQVDERKLSKIISKPWAADGKNFSDRIWQSKAQLVNELHTQLTRNCLLGKAPDDAIKAIANKFDVSKHQAGRLVMTEEAFIHSTAQKEAFDELGVEKYEIIATLDASTCEFCGAMDGQVFEMSEYQPGATAPPFHPWDRCCTAPHFDDMEGIGERFARDVITGEKYKLPKDITYQEWKAKQDAAHGVGTVDKVRKIGYNETADKKQFEDYKARLGFDAPKTFADFQKLKYDSPAAYNDLCGQYAYKGRVPEATNADYAAYKAVKATGVTGSVRVPPKAIDASILTFKDEHGGHHGCTLEEARSYITNAKCSITRKRWDGYHTGYYSLDGAAYVSDGEGVINTAFGEKDFDARTQSILGVFQ